MTNTTIEHSWHALETMTTVMLDAASAQDWNEVVLQSAARHRNFVEHFAQYPVSPATADFYRQRLNSLLSGEQELQALVRNARKALMSEGATITNQKRAMSAYFAGALG